ncbi:GntR family transcriptional regulator [Streptomyces sp. NPDC055089]
MLQALRQTLPPCPSVGWVAAEIERLIRTGELAPATRLSPASLVRELRVPREHVGLALTDLAAKGLVVVRATGRAVVAGTAPDAGRPRASRRRQTDGAAKGGARAA